MITISDEFMRQMMSTTRKYCVVILKAGPNRHEDGVKKIIWEHGRRNFALRAEGVLSIVCPISDGSNVAGIGIFNADVEEVKKIMDEDPGVTSMDWPAWPGSFFQGTQSTLKTFVQPEDCCPYHWEWIR